MRLLLSGILLVLGFCSEATAQWRRADITKIIYYSYCYGFFSSSKETWMEISPNGAMRMYNNTYSHDSTIEKLEQRGGRTISAEEFKDIFSDNQVQCYFSDKLPTGVYNDLTDRLLRMYADTTRFDFNCCCDVPYETATIYLKNGEKKRFMKCQGTANASTKDLVHYLDEISHRAGYKRATATFKFKAD